MTRGKYAAKANGQRAEAASNTVTALRGQIDEMRKLHAAEMAKAKSEINSLQGRLLREVRDLATAEVARAQQDAQRILADERKIAYERSIEVFRIIASHAVTGEDGVSAWVCVTDDPDDATADVLYPELITLLGVKPGDVWAALEEVDGGQASRDVRRETMQRYRLAVRGIPHTITTGEWGKSTIAGGRDGG